VIQDANQKTKKQQVRRKSEIDFSGLRTGNTIRGSILTKQAGPNAPSLANILATSGKDITRIETKQMQKAFPSFQDALAQFQKNGKSDELEKFLTEHPGSPLVFPASSPILQSMIKNKESMERTEQFSASYFKSANMWGDRQKHRAMFSLCSLFIQVRFHPKLAFRITQELRGELGKNEHLYSEKELKDFLSQAENLERNSKILWNVQKVHYGTQQEQQLALVELKETNRKDPFNPHVLYAIGSHARSEKRNMEAIEYYARIVALPDLSNYLQSIWIQDRIQRPPIDQTLRKMWEKEKGSQAGLVSYIEKLSAQIIDNFVTEEKKLEVKPDRRNVLLELFTGTECKNCVGLDVATTGISRRYSGDHVVVLRYHQHSGGSNPLANQQSKDRLSYYKTPSTPSAPRAPLLILNGIKPNYAKASIVHSSPIYSMYEELLDELLQEKSEVSIDLQARRAGDSIEVKALVKSKTLSKDWKLRIVLAEEEVKFHGKNGLRKHEMVVRYIPNGLKGFLVSKGKLEFERTISVKNIKQDLNEALTEHEKNENVEFFDKPLDLKNLHIVAFVQNSKTYEILQVVHVKVASGAKTTPTSAK